MSVPTKEVWTCESCGEVDANHKTRHPQHEVQYTWSYLDDPYINTSSCVQRLLNEYATHKKLIVAVDYDDTIFDFHGKGHTYPNVLEVLKRASSAGFYIVLFTATHPDKFPELRKFCVSQKIIIDAINENPIPLPFGNHGKIYYNILLDDRAGLGQALETLRAVLDKVEKQ